MLSTQFLAPALYASDDVVYPGGLALGGSVLPALYTDVDTIPAPAVIPGAVTLQPAAVSDPDTFYAPSLSASAGLLPALVADSDTFAAPAVALGRQFWRPRYRLRTMRLRLPAPFLARLRVHPAQVADPDAIYAGSILRRHRLAAATGGVDAIYAPALRVAQRRSACAGQRYDCPLACRQAFPSLFTMLMHTSGLSSFLQSRQLMVRRHSEFPSIPSPARLRVRSAKARLIQRVLPQLGGRSWLPIAAMRLTGTLKKVA